MSGRSARSLPRLSPDTEFFWTSGADGRLRFLCCRDCGHLVHPPAPICRQCRATGLETRAVSGRAKLWSYTIVSQPFVDWLPIPYVIGVVEIAEDPATHLTTNIVGCDPQSLRIGMDLRVTFEQHGKIFLPLFTPVEGDIG